MQVGKSLLITVLLAVSVCVWAQDVAEEEIESVSSTSVEFINYVGPHDRIDTIEQILGIGRALATQTLDRNSSATYAGKYRLVHAVDQDAIGLNADVIYFLSTSQVDHIVNVRRILAGYLEREYEYALQDALLLAEFVTIYNAVYRSRLPYFEENYTPIVLRNLSARSVGMSTVYSEWPGNSEIVIPLTGNAERGGLGSLDSDELTENEVIDELREQEDRGIPERKEITELKEREVERELDQIDSERDQVEAEREQVQVEREQVQQEQERLQEDREQAEESDDTERVAVIDEQQEQLEDQEEQLEDREAVLDEQERQLDEREQEQAERVERIQEEREEIADEERTLQEEQTETDAASGVAAVAAQSESILLLVARESDGTVFSTAMYLDSQTNTILAQSSVNSIRNRRVYPLEQGLLAVAGEDTQERDVKLVLLDAESLEEVASSEESIYHDSWIEVEQSGNVLAVYFEEDSWWLGRFDAELSLMRTSSIPVLPYSAIRIANDLLYVQDEEGRITVLGRGDLDPVRRVE